MIRDPPRHRVAVFHHIQPVHLRPRSRHFPTRRKLPNRLHIPVRPQKVAVQSQDNLRFPNQRNRHHPSPIDRPSHLIRQFITQWFVNRPSRLRKLPENLPPQALPGRRIVFLQQKCHPFTIPSLPKNLPNRRLKSHSIRRLSLINKMLRSVGVV